MSDFARFGRSAYIDKITRDIGHSNNSNSDRRFAGYLGSSTRSAPRRLQKYKSSRYRVPLIAAARMDARLSKIAAISEPSAVKFLESSPAIFPIIVHPELKKVFRGKKWLSSPQSRNRSAYARRWYVAR